MIAVVQRVRRASVTVEATEYTASIKAGLCVLLCAQRDDDDAGAIWMARKLAFLRIFSDAQGKMNRSVIDTGGSILLISQFTLAGDCRKGNRPSFIGAADPDEGLRLYERIAELLRIEHGLKVETGQFGAMMQVSLVNDGPVTLIVQTD